MRRPPSADIRPTGWAALEADRTPPDGPVSGRGDADGRVPRLLALGVLALASTSIAALLGDLYGVASMASIARWITVPGLALLATIGSVALPGAGHDELRRRIRVGAVAGVVGTVGYDVLRLPFIAAGMRLFAPIDSYGLLLADADMSSSWSGSLGWLFHLSNGVTFGVMYAVVAARRHWGWGVAWGLALETAVIASPFRERYGLAGEPVAIAIAYVAHVGFGYPVGRMVQRLRATDDDLRSIVARPALVTVGAAVLLIVLWQHPWRLDDMTERARSVAAEVDRPTTILVQDRFRPEWLRAGEDRCVHIVNDADGPRRTPFGGIPAGGGELCFDEPGIHRVTVEGKAFSGGFVYVRD